MSEIANAADTLELWKMVNDNVWAALLRLQKEEQARKAAEKKAAAKSVPSKRGMRNPPRVAQSKPQQRTPQTQPTAPPTAVQTPKPQQMARVAAVKPLQAQSSLQPQLTSPQNTAKPM